MQSEAVVFTGVDDPLQVVDLELPDPGPGEVLLRMGAAGVCHTDLTVRTGGMRTPTPTVLGHEGAGVVEAIGPGVADLLEGDHAVVSWVPQCGRCWHCQRGEGNLCEPSSVAMGVGGRADGSLRLTWRGQPLAQWSAVGTFATRTVVDASALVPVDRTVPLPVAALVGCGALTGVGAVLNDGQVVPGNVVVVIGCGGVGLNVVQGARLAGAGTVVAVDPVDSQRDLAADLGADVVVAPEAVADAVGDLTGGRGADVVFEVVGRAETIEQAVRLARRGGRTVLVGIPDRDVRLDLRVFAGIVYQAKTIVGSWYGGSVPRRDVPVLIDHYRAGRLVLDRLVSRTVSLGEVEAALAELEERPLARSVVDLS